MTHSSRWQRARRAGSVHAVRRGDAWHWTTGTGEVMSARPGDWQVTGPDGAVRSVSDEAFRASYEPIGDDEFRRTGVFAVRFVTSPEVVETLEGPTEAAAGDWVVRGSMGEEWPVPGSEFLSLYTLVDGSPECGGSST